MVVPRAYVYVCDSCPAAPMYTCVMVVLHMYVCVVVVPPCVHARVMVVLPRVRVMVVPPRVRVHVRVTAILNPMGDRWMNSSGGQSRLSTLHL